MSRPKNGPTRRRPPKQRPWDPLVLTEPANPQLYLDHGLTIPDAVWGNDLYSVFVRELRDDKTRKRTGALHISFHRRDRAPVSDWRHMQAIKNTVAGPERLGVQIFPPESCLVDTSNEYHLFVLPEGESLPYLWGGSESLVMTPEDLEVEMGKTKAQQRAWQPGIPTGKGVAA